MGGRSADDDDRASRRAAWWSRKAWNTAGQAQGGTPAGRPTAGTSCRATSGGRRGARAYLSLVLRRHAAGRAARTARPGARWMERLAEFRPHLAGAVWRGTATRLRRSTSTCTATTPRQPRSRSSTSASTTTSAGAAASAEVDCLAGRPARARRGRHAAPRDPRPRRPARCAQPDARGRTWRGDPAALRRLLAAEAPHERRAGAARLLAGRGVAGRMRAGALPVALAATRPPARLPADASAGAVDTLERCAFRAPKAANWRWPTFAAGPWCSTSGPPGARPASRRCPRSTASPRAARRGWQVRGPGGRRAGAGAGVPARAPVGFTIGLAGIAGTDLAALGNTRVRCRSPCCSMPRRGLATQARRDQLRRTRSLGQRCSPAVKHLRALRQLIRLTAGLRRCSLHQGALRQEAQTQLSVRHPANPCRSTVRGKTRRRLDCAGCRHESTNTRIGGRPRADVPEDRMDLRKLKTLIDLVSESNISELEITEAEGKVRIVKAGAAAPAQTPWPCRLPQRAPARPAGGTARGRAGRRRGSRRAGRDRPGRQVADGRHLLPRRQPGRQALRRGRRRGQGGRAGLHHRGDEDHERDRGRLRRHDQRILCENGQAVEFGQPLFIVE